MSYRPAITLNAMAVAIALSCTGAGANGYGESSPWQFDSSADKANKAVVLDVIERKKGGYYDAFQVHNTINNTTNIDRQVNCTVSAAASGNGAENGMTANSPIITNNAEIDAETTGNSAHNSNGGGSGGESDIDNDQDIEDSDLVSVVEDARTSSRSGAVDSGRSRQVLNNDQVNTGDQFASVEGSEGCSFASGTLN